MTGEDATRREGTDVGEQLGLVPLPHASDAASDAAAPNSSESTSAGSASAESTSPTVAAVRPLLAVPHLDRDFEYEIPEKMLADVQFGVAVKVRFGGQDVTGYVVDVRHQAEHPGQLKPLRRVVSSTPVLTPELWDLAQQVARHGAGTVSDVLRLAIPTRHAAAEKALEPQRKAAAARSDHSGVDDSEAGPQPAPAYDLPTDAASTTHPWAQYRGGFALLKHLAAGDAPGAAWIAAAGQDVPTDWPAAVAELVAACRASGRGSLLILPNARDVELVRRACVARLGEHGIVRLTAEDGPSVRYTAFLSALHGLADVVIGTRAAMFAPVRPLGLALWWDDVDALHAEPRAPYPHVRDVLRLRADQEQAALINAGYVRSAAVHRLVETGRLMSVDPIGRSSARVIVTGDDHSVERSGPAARARIPAQAWAGARRALERGPVLVQVPRRGYIPALACTRCRTKATCPVCHGPLGAQADHLLRCEWCGHQETSFTCTTCGGHDVRSLVIGAGRTAEELGRAFTGVPIRRSGAPHILDQVSPEPALVIATPGAEPHVPGGYAAAMLLDAWAFLDRPGLGAAERSLQAWSAATALVRPAAAGGEVFLCGVPRHTPFPEVEALVRWAPGWHAERELHERAETMLPPQTRMAALEGERKAVQAMADALLAARTSPSDFDVLGPLPLGRRHSFDTGSRTPVSDALPEPGHEPMRYLIRWADPDHDAVPQLLHDVKATRAAKREAPVTVRVDPMLDGF